MDVHGFCIPRVNVVDVLDGETVSVLLLSNCTQVGVAKRSASGKAMNFLIAPFLYTSPLSRVMDVLEGRSGKGGGVCGEGWIIPERKNCRGDEEKVIGPLMQPVQGDAR